MNGVVMSSISAGISGLKEAFSYNKLANGFSAIGDLFKAYKQLRGEVTVEDQFEMAARNLVLSICDSNLLLQQSVSNENLNDRLLALGVLSVLLDENARVLLDSLHEKCPYYYDGKLAVQVSICANQSNFLLIEQNTMTVTTELMVKRMFYNTLRSYPSAHFEFVDLVGGGSAFPFAQEIISAFPTRSNGCISISEYDFEKTIEKLSNESMKAIALLGDSFDSAFSYNQEHKMQIPKRFVAILLGEGLNRSVDALNKLKTVISNREKNNMDFVLIGKNEVTNIFANVSNLYLRDLNGRLVASRNVAFKTSDRASVDSLDVNELIAMMKSTGKVDTKYESNIDLFPEYLSMESSEALRIPFALGENGELQYFEIGGAAATHALISGKTGCGKSVALHTLIMQIICNYHPDDVEIWAIDYKAVEFDWYIKHKAPHFRVIARDSSDEFSYSLLDLVYGEYEKRKQLFLDEGVVNISQYRKKKGLRSMPRIIVFIDEFQIMTQAVQSYTGEKDYRKVLENLLRLTRAMGISFVFCSQTVASGLGGLTEPARDQIACRLCMQQQSVGEIRETLAINGTDETGVIQRVENLRKGQAIYKRMRWQNEHAHDGKAYETKLANIIFMSEEQKLSAINDIINRIGDDYSLKEEILVRGEARTPLLSKKRHPVIAYLSGKSEPGSDCIEWYPAAPASLEDFYRVDLEDAAGSNVLLTGENDDLRDSIVMHSVISWLSDPRNEVVGIFVNESYPDRKRMIDYLQILNSNRLSLKIGTRAALSSIESLRKIRPNYGARTIYLWYGLDRLENEIFLLNQEECDEEDVEKSLENPQIQNALDDLTAFLAELDNSSKKEKSIGNASVMQSLDYSDCKKIIRQAFERGPENNQFHFAIFNNRKGMKKAGIVDFADFDNRIGTKMGSEDAFDLFGTSQAMKKANESTVVYSSAGGRCIPLRPYLMPTEEEFDYINYCIQAIDAK